MKKCPYCAEDIKKDAVKCKHCGEWLKEKKKLIKSEQLKLEDTLKKDNKKSKNKWSIVFPILGILLILIGISKLGKGASEGFFSLVPGITTLLAYFSYKGAKNRIKKNKNKYFLELSTLIIFTLIYALFLKYINFGSIINHPISILPLFIYFFIYFKINFINKDRKKNEVIRIVFSLLVSIILLTLVYSYNNQNKVIDNTNIAKTNNKIITLNDLLWYDNVSLGNFTMKTTIINSNNSNSNYYLNLYNILNFLIKNYEKVKILENKNIIDKKNNFEIGNTCYKNMINKPCIGNGEYNVSNDLYETGLRPLFLKLYSNSKFTYYISEKEKYYKFIDIYKKYLFELDKIER